MKDLIEAFKSARYDFPFGFYLGFRTLDEEELWEIFRGSEDNPTFVAEVDGKTVGLAELSRHWKEKDNLYIELLLVHRDYRGKGVGSKLIERSFLFAVEKGYNVLSLNTWRSNKAFYLYQNRGFCWMSDTAPYMVNFLPQLMKSDIFKTYFKDPRDLFWSLLNRPEKTSIEGYVAWRYRLKSSDGEIEVIFDEESRKLLRVKTPSISIELIPPESKRYFKGQDIEIKMTSTSTLPAMFDDTLYILKPNEPLVIKTKAKKEITLRVENLNFGLNLDVRDKVNIYTKIDDISPIYSRAKVIIFNESEEELVDKLIIEPLSKDLYVKPRAHDVRIEPKSSAELEVIFAGYGRAKLAVGETSKTITIGTPKDVWFEEDTVITPLWTISKDEITYKGEPSISIWYQINVGGNIADFKFDEGKFVYETEEFKLNMKPKFVGETVILDFYILSKTDLQKSFRLYTWFYVLGKYPIIILPKDKETYLKAPVLMHFPQGFSIIRKKLDPPFIGFLSEKTGLLYNFDNDTYITLFHRGRPEFIREISLKKGEVEEFSIALKPISKRFLRGKNVVDAIELKREKGGVFIKNNWYHELQVELKIHDKKVKVNLKPDEEKVICRVKGFECLPVETNILGHTTRKNMLVYRLLKKWVNNIYRTEKSTFVLSEIGGGLKQIIVDEKNLLEWWNQPRGLSTRVYMAYGGMPLHIRKGDKQYDLATKKWTKAGEGVFEIEHDKTGVKITREWYVLNDKTILERIRIVNLKKWDNTVKIIESIFLSGDAIEFGDIDNLVRGDPSWFYTLKYAWIKTSSGEISVLSLDDDTEIEIEKPVKEAPNITFATSVELEPLAEKIYERIISINKEELKRIFEKCFQ